MFAVASKVKFSSTVKSNYNYKRPFTPSKPFLSSYNSEFNSKVVNFKRNYASYLDHPNPELSNPLYTPKPAIDMIAEVPVIEVDDDTVPCNGGDESLGHPLVWIKLDSRVKEPQTCLYCGLRYLRKKHQHHH